MAKCGRAVYHLRKQKGWTQQELGKKLNVSYQAVSKWEKDLSQPDFGTIATLCALFAITLDDFNALCEGGSVAKSYQPVGAAANLGNRPAQGAGAQEQQAFQPEQTTCALCRRHVQEQEIYQRSPLIVCQTCQARKTREMQELNQMQAQAGMEQKGRGKRRLRLILLLSAGIAVALFLLLLWASGLEEIGSSLLLAYIAFSFSFQIGCGNFILDLVSGSFGRGFAMPGVIFSLDLDSILFALAYKLIVAPLIALLLSIAIAIGGLLLALIISPLSFPFALVQAIVRVNRTGDID